MKKKTIILFSSILMACICVLGFRMNVFAAEDHLQVNVTKKQIKNAIFYGEDDKKYTLNDSYEGTGCMLDIEGIKFGSDKIPFYNRGVLKVTSSNEQVVAVDVSYYHNNPDLVFKKKGCSVITISVDIYSSPDEYGRDEYIGTVTYSKKIKVTSLKKKVKAPEGKYLLSQTNSYAYYNKVELALEVLKGDVYYEIYRSDKKSSGFKKIKTLKVSYSRIDYTLEVNGKQFEDIYDFGDAFPLVDKKGIKANKRYYYKVRCKEVPESSTYSCQWSPFSKTEVYYTALKPLSKKQYSYNASTGKGRWKKVKNAVGYVYEAHHGCFRGYNIFGKKLYHFASYDVPVKSNVIHKKYLGVNKTDRMDELKGVSPITKHGKYYYVHEKQPQKSIKGFKYVYSY